MFAALGMRIIFSMIEDDVLPDGVSVRVDGARRFRRLAVGVNANLAEVVTEAGFHKVPRWRVQRASGRRERVVDNRRSAADAVVTGGAPLQGQLILRTFFAFAAAR